MHYYLSFTQNVVLYDEPQQFLSVMLTNARSQLGAGEEGKRNDGVDDGSGGARRSLQT